MFDMCDMFDMRRSHVWQYETFDTGHVTCTCVTLCAMCAMTHPCVWLDSFICVTWLIHMCDMTSPHVWHASFTVWLDLSTRVAWLICTRDMPHPYSRVWHDSSMRKSNGHMYSGFADLVDRVHVCDMTHSLVWMTNSRVWHDSFTCVA